MTAILAAISTRVSLRRPAGMICAAVFVLNTVILNAADWPMHRGEPQLQGRSTEAAPKQPKQRWVFKADSAVKGGAAIAQERVYFGDESGMLHCVSLVDGQKIWEFKAEGGIEATPLILDGMCYFGASDGKMYALDAADGTKQWQFQTDDKILAGANWAKDPTSDAKWILVGSYDFKFYALDALTGKELWRTETENFINSTPAVSSDGYAFFGGCDSLLHVVSLAERKEVRVIQAEAYIPGSAAADGHTVYLGNEAKKVFAFDAMTGGTLWSYRARNFAYYSSPALSADAVFIGGRDKRLHCIDRKTGEARWDFATKGAVDSSPVLCSDGGVIFGSNDGRLYCVEAVDGKERWSFEIGGEIPGSPAIAAGSVVIGSDDGSVYCIGSQ
jgi:eukaryotic-like serine/threonine-protein kinase